MLTTVEYRSMAQPFNVSANGTMVHAWQLLDKY
jgi:hypothetical protein